MFYNGQVRVGIDFASIPLLRNPAVKRCSKARLRALKESRKQKLDFMHTAMNLEVAYHGALPEIVDQQSISDFVACVTYGMVLGAVDNIDGPKLLYAARIATNLMPKEYKIRGKSTISVPIIKPLTFEESIGCGEASPQIAPIPGAGPVLD